MSQPGHERNTAGAAGEMNGRSPLYRREFLGLLAMQLAFGASLSTFLLLPKFLKMELGAGALEISLVASMFGVSSVIAVPFAGGWIDRNGTRRAIIVGNLFLAAGGLGFVLVKSVGPLALALRALQGLSWNLVFNAGMIFASMIAPAERLAQAIGIFGSANLITNAVAPALAEPLIDRVGYRPVFAASGVIALVAWALGRRLVEPVLRGTRPPGRQTLLALVQDRRFRRLLTVSLVSGLAFGVMFTFPPPFALQLGMRNVRSFFIAYATGAILTRLVSGRLVDRVGHQRSAIVSLLVYGCVVASTAALRPGLLPLFGGLFGMSHGMFFPAIMAMAIDPTSSQRGQPLMLMSGTFASGMAFVPLMGGLADAVGYPPVFITSGVACLAVVGLLPRQPAGT